MKRFALLLLAAAGIAAADKLGEKVEGSTHTKKLPVRLGPDGRPLLFGPDIKKCQESKSQIRHF